MTDFSARLNYALSARKMGKNQLEKLAGLSRGYASRLTRGRAQMPTIPVIDRIASALGVTRSFLIDGALPMLVEDLVVAPQFFRRQFERMGWEPISRMLAQDDKTTVQAWAIVGASELPFSGDISATVSSEEILALALEFQKSGPDEATRKRLDLAASQLFARPSNSGSHKAAPKLPTPIRRRK